jgi:antitoxin ParD1/3/4
MGRTMPTRNVVLTNHHEDIIDHLVKSGRYQNASEVLREGLRLIEQRENLEAIKLEALRDAGAAGFADLDDDRFIEVPDSGLDEFITNIGLEAEERIRKAGA